MLKAIASCCNIINFGDGRGGNVAVVVYFFTMTRVSN